MPEPKLCAMNLHLDSPRDIAMAILLMRQELREAPVGSLEMRDDWWAGVDAINAGIPILAQAYLDLLDWKRDSGP